jgi:hypothetical protein
MTFTFRLELVPTPEGRLDRPLGEHVLPEHERPLANLLVCAPADEARELLRAVGA